MLDVPGAKQGDVPACVPLASVLPSLTRLQRLCGLYGGDATCEAAHLLCNSVCVLPLRKLTLLPRPGLDARAAEAVDDTLCALLAGWVAEGFLPLLRVVHEGLKVPES